MLRLGYLTNQCCPSSYWFRTSSTTFLKDRFPGWCSSLFFMDEKLIYDRDNVDSEYLEHPRTWSAWSIVRFMVCLGPFSSPFDIITFSINWRVLLLFLPSLFLKLPEGSTTRFAHWIPHWSHLLRQTGFWKVLLLRY